MAKQLLNPSSDVNEGMTVQEPAGVQRIPKSITVEEIKKFGVLFGEPTSASQAHSGIKFEHHDRP